MSQVLGASARKAPPYYSDRITVRFPQHPHITNDNHCTQEHYLQLSPKRITRSAIKAAGPATLDEVRLPDSLAAFVVRQKIDYQLTEKAYALQWELPRWHAVFDGETGKVNFVQMNGGAK